MAKSYTVDVTVTPGNDPPITVSPSALDVDEAGTVYWVFSSNAQTNTYDFKSLELTPITDMSTPHIGNNTIFAADSDTVSATVAYTIYAKGGGTIYESDPYIINRSE